MSTSDRFWLALLCGLTLIAAALLAFPVSHLGSPLSFNYSEGWNAYWDASAAAGRPLYGAAPDLTITNYPALSFHLVGLLGRVAGGVTVAGRVLALACLLWSAVNVGTAAATLTRSGRAGWYAALCLLLWVALLTPGRIATNDPHFLGLALVTLGVCAVLRASGVALWIGLAALFFAAALFVKPNLLAFPLATAVYLGLTRQGRALGVFTLVGSAVAAGLTALTLAVDGPFLFAHLLAPRAFSRADGVENVLTFCSFFYAPVLIATAGLAWARAERTGLVALWFGAAVAAAAFFGFGNGVTYNIYYEALAAMAIGVAVVLDLARRRLAPIPHGWLPFAALALLPVAAVLVHTPGELYGALGRSGRLPQRAAEHAATVALVAEAPGPALCESLLICFEAGKPFGFDAYFVKDQIRIGHIPEGRIIAALNDRRFGVIEIGEDDVGGPLVPGERLRFTAPVMTAMLANYRVERPGGPYAVLVPR